MLFDLLVALGKSKVGIYVDSRYLHRYIDLIVLVLLRRVMSVR
jgi:hypothetical protein